MESNYEKAVISKINSFRENPKSVIRQIELRKRDISHFRAKDPFLKEIDTLINLLSKIKNMNKLSNNNTLNQAAKVEMKKFIKEGKKYNKYLTGSQLKGIVPDGFLKENAALIADYGTDEINTLVVKLLLGKDDKEKKARVILTTQEYTQIGISSINYDGEKYFITIFANRDSQDTNERASEKIQSEDLSRLREAFDIYDRNKTHKIKINEAIEGMKMVGFDKINPALFNIILELKNNEWCTWTKFASHIWSRITDRNSDEGLRTLFDLFIDDPKKDTITFDTFKRICQELGEKLTDEKIRDMLAITNKSAVDISFEEFCQYMRFSVLNKD